jgi:DNA invertase Pin-like site-specific DNA recombinase
MSTITSHQQRTWNIAAARNAGKQFGRKKALSADQVEDIRERVIKGAAKSLLAAEYSISRTTLYSALAN